jgi:hypothetical protein
MQYDIPSIVVEFILDGELHKCIRTSTSARVIGIIKNDKDYLASMKATYEAMGAEILAVYALETSQIALDNIDTRKLYVAKAGNAWKQFAMKFFIALTAFTVVNGFLIAHLVSKHHNEVVRLLGGQ